MKRVFSSVIFKASGKSPFFPNKFISEIYEGIHNNGGEVLTMQISCMSRHLFGGEHLLITYEDNEHYEEIEKVLKDKRDNFEN